jgi:hypothetical protein
MAGAAASHTSSSDDGVPFEQAASQVFAQLQFAVSEVLRPVSGDVRRSADLEHSLGVDRKLCWQIYRIVSAGNPLAVGVHVPARVSMERFLKAAAGKGSPVRLVEGARTAFDAFERLVAEHAGDRREFDSLVASSLPQERERTQLASREAMYESSRTIRGVAVEASFFTGIFCPSREDPARLDVARVSGWVGLRRIRRGAHVEYMLQTSAGKDRRILTLDGGPIGDITDVVLREFSSEPAPRLTPRPGGADASALRYVVEGEDVGVKAAVDISFADYMPAPIGRFATPERPTIGTSFGADNPTRWTFMDVLVEEGVMPVQTPDVRVYDVVPRGYVAPVPAPERECDRVPFAPAVRYMGRGVETFRSLYVPHYHEMLAVVCRKRGWDPSRLHGYRVEIEYPVYSWNAVMTLPLPAGPDQTAG